MQESRQPRRAAPRQGEIGVTLIELLIASGIFVILAAMLVQILRVGQNSLEVTNSTSGARADQQRLFALLVDPLREGLSSIHSVNGELTMPAPSRAPHLVLSGRCSGLGRPLSGLDVRPDGG